MWIIYTLAATLAVSMSDAMRKLGSTLQDPFQNNLVFQIGSVTTALILWLVFSRHFELQPTRGIVYALIGGSLIAVFTALLFKALAIGPGVSTVVPIIRVGGILLVGLFGVLFFQEKLTWSMALGGLLALGGVYLILSGK
ncbi:EamA family transporter [Candidatus Parcubacteria bacterium]|nr:EamA family transporter [Candidatus Parcubacteria bacterium]